MIETERLMRKLAKMVDTVTTETVGRKGFMVLLFELGRPGISNYISNASRADMITALRETADRLEQNQDIPPAHPTKQ